MSLDQPIGAPDQQPAGFKASEIAADLVTSRMWGGSAWMVVLQVAVRAIGFLSTLVLVRVLSPKDFGVVAIATMVTGLFEVFAETGQRLAIIRREQITNSVLDTAFTIQIAICTTLALLTFFAAPLGHLYFSEPRVDDVIRLLALRPLIMGFANIGTVAFRRDLDFAKEFRFGMYSKLGSSVLTILLAFALQSYWALALGIIAGQIAGVAMGYLMHPYRPHLSLKHAREIWSFSIWMLAGHVAMFLQSRMDQFALGGTVNSAALGKYVVAADTGAMPTSELVMPVGRALFPTFARLARKPLELKQAYLSSLASQALVCWSTGVGLASVAPDFTAVVLGPQWTDAAPVVRWAALTIVLFALSNSALILHQAAGRVHGFTVQTWLRVLLLAPVVFIAAQQKNLELVAQSRFLVTLIFVPLLLWSLRSVAGLRMTDIISVNWRPIIASIVMACVVAALGANLADWSASARLAVCTAAGAAVFPCAVIGLWILVGRPDSIERTVTTWIQELASGKSKEADEEIPSAR